MNLNWPPVSDRATSVCYAFAVLLFVGLWAAPLHAADGMAKVTGGGPFHSDVALAADPERSAEGDVAASGFETIHPWDNNESRDTTAINGVIQLPGRQGAEEMSASGLDVPPLSKSAAAPSLPSDVDNVGNFPNPFNAQTQIRFTLRSAGDVEVRIFNLLGQTVRQVRLAGLTAGPHDWVWDGRVHRGGEAPSGVYFYQVASGGSSVVHRMVLLK